METIFCPRTASGTSIICCNSSIPKISEIRNEIPGNSPDSDCNFWG
ncbi:hypothetical protein F383_17671 [Gossypium arboreum]|uniref:Uncharacterized protein n=1 Tax=Gossypium arboreum TaxID=29729 RepID=A0A0B0MJD3_GOSAR|nr:hypothetical protein F383_17671 [Gossypium arboreum]